MSSAPPDAVWAVVGNPRRLPDWTDVTGVESVNPEPVQVGTEVVTVGDDGVRSWLVTTAEPRLLELEADTPRGRFGLGCRVALDQRGSRLILAARLDASGLRAQLLEGPALRRRLDRWCNAALEAAGGPAEG